MPKPTEPLDDAGFPEQSFAGSMHAEDSQSLDHFDESVPQINGRSWVGKWIRRLIISTVVVIGLVAASIYLILVLAYIKPDFYQTAMKVDPQEQKKRGSEMETQMLNLRNSIIASEKWSAEFTEDQINGWLAWDLKEKFPAMLPPEVTNPRLNVGKDKTLTLAFECEAKPFRGIGVVEAEVFLTGVVNQLGIRFKSIRSGIVPIPLALLADQISSHAAKQEIEIEWTNQEGDPVILMKIPDSILIHSGNYIEFEVLEIGNDKVKISGTTHLGDY